MTEDFYMGEENRNTKKFSPKALLLSLGIPAAIAVAVTSGV